MVEDSAALATEYFRAWKAKDFAALRAILADDSTFRGPLGSADDADTCVQGLRGMAEIMTDIVIHKVFVDGPDVLTWFDLHTTVAPPSTTANWTHTQNGKITTIHVTFDARDLAAGLGRRPSTSTRVRSSSGQRAVQPRRRTVPGCPEAGGPLLRDAAPAPGRPLVPLPLC